MARKKALRNLAANLACGEISYETEITRRLEQARLHPDIFISVNDDAIGTAIALDQRRGSDGLPMFAGVPVSLKDLFDVAGQTTLAGSIVLREYVKPADRDADVVAPLRDAGMVFIGRTNMSEFAFSGMGLNPHYPPLYSVWDRSTGRLPGGSSSGSAVSVAMDIVPATLGSDTAGSCRIPAAFNGIVGVKPSYGRLSSRGVYPLSHSSDAPGPLGADLDSCFILDRLMAGHQPSTIEEIDAVPFDQLRLLVPEGRVMQDLDDEVARAFEIAIGKLKNAGAMIVREPLPGLDECVEMFLNRPVAVYEAWQLHQQMLAEHDELYDPYVRKRILPGRDISEADQAARYQEKAALVERVETAFRDGGHDAIVFPTVACIPPAIAETADPETIGSVNLRCLRNTATVNYFDGCAVSLPASDQGAAPVGLMVSALHGMDDEMYRIAAAVESCIDKKWPV